MLRKPPDEQREHGGVGHALGQVGLQHRELVQVGEEPKLIESGIGHSDIPLVVSKQAPA
jgi:hypothetical protein